jgi:glycopeptide antibiotics resistance protein
MLLFGFYIIEAINLLFFPISIPDNWPANLTQNETLRALQNVNLSPFYFLSFSNRSFSLRWVFVDFGLNALLTIPFGFGVSYFHRPGFLKLCLWAICTGITTEGIQLLVKLGFGTYYHVVDINDAILNALGVLIGYFLFLLFKRIFQKKRKPKEYTKTMQSVD